MAANPTPCKMVPHYDASLRQIVYTKQCHKDAQQKIDQALNTITPAKHSVLSKQLKQESSIAQNPFAINFYEPNYILPYYYTGSTSPYYAQHPSTTPLDQPIQHAEFKMQISALFPLWYHMFGSRVSLNSSYTQMMYWQIYSKSPFFRETNYEPRLFLSFPIHQNWLLSLGFDHQSNGRGGSSPGGMERSWNRIFMDIVFSGDRWIVRVEPWTNILNHSSSDIHNPDIMDYMGYGRIIFAFKTHRQTFSVMIRNQFESGFKRGAIEFDYSIPIWKKTKGLLQIFSGYGQSLIEYNHRTTSIGLGLAISNWL